MQNIKAQLLRAVQQGAALATVALVAGCAGKSSGDATNTDAGRSSVGDSSGARNGGNATNGGGGDGPVALAAYPLEQIRCEGPSFDGGFYGQCCFEAHCYTPEAGSDCAPATSNELSSLLPEYPPGSGSCGCMAEEFPTTGPFAPRDDATPASAGACCYVIGSIGCLGRPLLVVGDPILAPVARRGDWGGALGVA